MTKKVIDKIQRGVGAERTSISSVSIKYNDGVYQVFEGASPVSCHTSLAEAKLIKRILDSEKTTSERAMILLFERRYVRYGKACKLLF